MHTAKRPLKNGRARGGAAVLRIKNYYEHGGEALCSTIHPVPIKSFLDEAKKLNVSFYRDIEDDSRSATR